MKNLLSLEIPFRGAPSQNTSTASYGYGGGSNYSHSSGGAKYPGGLSGYGYGRHISNNRVRQNAREAFHDTPEAKAIITRFADTIVDTGLKLEATPNAAILGLSPEEAEEWSRNTEARFDLWAKSKKSDRRGLNNFYQNQRLYQISQQRDNDIFVRFHYTKKKSVPNSLQISILDPNQIKGESITSTYSFSSTNDGITRNEQGEELSYSVCVKNDNTNEIKFVEVPRVGSRSGRIMMVHGFSAEYAGQNRGYSRIEHVLQEFDDLTDFKLSNIKKAISQSQITMFVKPSADNDASNPFQDIAATSGPVGTAPLAVDESEITTQLEGCPVRHSLIPEAQIREPGSVGVFNLAKGEELKPFVTQSNSEDFDKFMETYMSYVSASTGMPIEVLLMKFGQNYSASRGTLLLFWRIVVMWRVEMATDFLDPAYESWLSEEIAAGRIDAPGFSDPILRQAWLSNNWIGAPMPNIDPMRTAKAEKEYLEMGATNLDRVAREYNGSDGATNRAKLKKQYEELPIAPWSGLIVPENTEEDSDEDEE